MSLLRKIHIKTYIYLHYINQKIQILQFKKNYKKTHLKTYMFRNYINKKIIILKKNNFQH